MTLTAPTITEEDRRKYPSYTDGAIIGKKLIESLSDENLKSLTTGRDNKVRKAVLEIMGENTNPSWITCSAASFLYDRDLIDGKELDRICQ